MVAEFVVSATSPEQFPPPGLPEIAFLGRSNVGKSSLLNTITGKRGLAFTSARPGCTQMINFFRVDDRYHLVDLPGYGFARVPVEVKGRWKRLIESYLSQRETLALAVVLLDCRRGWMEGDLELKSWLEYQEKPYIVVATKIDKLSKSQEIRALAQIRSRMSDTPLIPFSAETGRGVREFWQAISKTRTNRP